MLGNYSRLVGISVNISDPVVGNVSLGTRIRFSNNLESYSHVNAANFGYKSATFTVKISPYEVSDWLEYGLARHVETIGVSGDTVWEGFIDRVSISFGSLSATRGPLFDIANRVSVVYTPIIDANVNPVVTGSETETPIAEDTDSQDRYGIIEKVISGGQRLDDGTTDEAEEIRDLYLAEMAYPYTDEQINIGSSVYPILTVECLGYKHWLNAYVHNDYVPSTVTLDTKIKYVLNSDPNSIFSTDQSNIDANAQLTNRLDDQNRFGGTIIEDIVGLGDGSDNRWLFKVLNGRICYYEAVPTSIEYYHSLSGTDRSNISSVVEGISIEPWQMQAGKWIQITDFLIGEGSYNTMREDPRIVFAEEVTYTMPFGLAITGSKISKLTQRLKQLGVGGA